MANLNYFLSQARSHGQALGHFNFSTLDVLQAIVEGAKEAGATAVMVGTSEGEAEFVGMKEAVAMTKAVSGHYNLPVFLNADHFRSFEKCKEAIDAGYDSVIIDPKEVKYPDNIPIAKKVVDYARSKNSDISVEGELGYLKGSSEVQKSIEINPADFTKPEEVKEFVNSTGVNRLAVVFGNVHGIVTEQEEKLDVEHFRKIVIAEPNVFYVLHGASGLSDGDILMAVRAGISNVHFNTELRVAYRGAIEKVFQEKPNETTPYKYLSPGAQEVRRLVFHKTQLFLGKL